MDKHLFFAFLFSVTGSVLILLGSGLFRPSTWLRATPQCKPEQPQGCFIWCQLEELLQDSAAFSTRSASSRASASFGVSSSPGAPPLLLPVLTSMAESDNSGSCAPRCALQRAPEGCWCQVWIRHWVSRGVHCKNSLSPCGRGHRAQPLVARRGIVLLSQHRGTSLSFHFALHCSELLLLLLLIF